MNIQEIKSAVDSGNHVQWCSPAYRVIKDSLGQYLVECMLNGHCWGLTNIGGDRLNGDESEFSITQNCI